jgi:hypothetical protein
VTGVWHAPQDVAVSLNTAGFAQTLGVSCGAVGNCGAIGSYKTETGPITEQPFVANEVGGVWRAARQVSVPNDGLGYFTAISCPSAGNCSAVGEVENIAAFVIDETDGTWGQLQELEIVDNVGVELNAVSCSSAGDCVAGGTLGYGGQAFLVTETGGAWGVPRAVPGSSDVDASITSISCPRAGYCAAGGNYDAQPRGPLPGVGYPFVVNETAGTWGSVTPLKGPFGTSVDLDAVDTVTSVSCSSPGNCGAGGYYGAYQGTRQAFVDSEAHGTWGTAQEVAGKLDAGDSGYVYSVSCPANGSCVAAGTYADAAADREAFVVSEVAGKWKPAQEVAAALNTDGYAVLWSVSCVSAGNCSAGGSYSDAARDGAWVALVVTETGGVWNAGQAVARSPVGGNIAEIFSISCPAVRSCAAGGDINDSSDNRQAFVVSETPATVPGAPVKVTAAGGGSKVTVKWAPPKSNGGAAITGYFIYFGTKSGKESPKPVNAKALSPTTRSYVVKGLKKSVRYYLFVRARNAAGLGAPANRASGGAPAATGAAASAWPAAPSVVTHSGGLSAVAATSASNAWAVGTNISGTTLILHWNGSAWKQQASPTPGASGDYDALTGVAATSAKNAWAVGTVEGPRSQAVILHWNGSAWEKQPSPAAAATDLAGVAATSVTNAWAVGSGGGRPLVLHWNGRSWKQQATPAIAGAALEAVAATSAKNAWAVGLQLTSTGSGAAGTPIILHWNGTAWARVPTHLASGIGNLRGVAATSASNAWAVGCTGCLVEGAGVPLIERWNGTSWAKVTGPSAEALDGLWGVAATSPTNAWAIGGGGITTDIAHWNGRAWTMVPSPTPGGVAEFVNGIAATSASNAWAVGQNQSTTPFEGVIAHWNGRSWK